VELLSGSEDSLFALAYEETKHRGEMERSVIESSEPKFGSDKSHQVIGAVVVAAIVVMAFIYIAFHTHKLATVRSSTDVSQSTDGSVAAKDTENASVKESQVTAVNKPEVASNTSAVSTQIPVEPAQTSVRAIFVLQVAAMGHKENADALAGSLRQLNLPVFVLEAGRDGLYRVMVGPYSDADSTFRAQKELKAHDFGSIRKRLNSDGQD
jgi:septal ring-binding cell division protein DamX